MQQQTSARAMFQFLTPKDPDLRLAQFSREGDVEKVTTFITKHDADVNYVHYNGFSCLHWAAANGHAQVVQILLNHGAIVNQINKDYMTALHLAAISGHESVIRILADRGADIDARDDVNSTPLHYAGQWGRDTVIQALLSRGADVHAKEDSGLTPLHLAAYDGHIAAVRMLIAAGANLKEQDIYGQTPLTCARNKQHNDVVKMLRERAVQEMKFCEAIDSANMIKSNLVRAKSAPHPSRTQIGANACKASTKVSTKVNTNTNVASSHGNLLRAASVVSDETSTSSLVPVSKQVLIKTFSLRENQIPHLDSPTSDNDNEDDDSDSDNYRRYSDGGDDEDDSDDGKRYGKHLSESNDKHPIRKGKSNANVNDLSRHNSINSSFNKSRSGNMPIRTLANAVSLFERESSSDLTNNEANSRTLTRSNTSGRKSVSFQKEAAASNAEIAKVAVINERELKADQSKDVVVRITPVNKTAQLSVSRAATAPPLAQQQPSMLQRSKSADAATQRKANSLSNGAKRPAASPANTQAAARSSVPAKVGAAPVTTSVKAATTAQRLAVAAPASAVPKPSGPVPSKSVAAASKSSLDNKTAKTQASAATAPAVKSTAGPSTTVKPMAASATAAKSTAALATAAKSTAALATTAKSTAGPATAGPATAVKSAAVKSTAASATAASATAVRSTAPAVPMSSSVKVKPTAFPTGLDKNVAMPRAPAVQVLSPSHRLQGKTIH